MPLLGYYLFTELIRNFDSCFKWKKYILHNSNASSNHTISPIKQKGVGRGNVQEFGEMYYWKIFKKKILIILF